MAEKKKEQPKLLEFAGRKEQRMGISRGTAEWVLKEIRRQLGEGARQFGGAIRVLASSANIYPQSFALVPAEFVGPRTDEFYNLTGLTGPYHDGLSNLTAVANGYLTLSGTDVGVGRGSMGSERGTFLPRNGVWTITLKITGVSSTTYPREVGFGLSPTVFADGGTWNYPQTRIYFNHQTGTPLYRIYWLDQGGGGTLNVGNLPTRTDPIYLRCAQTWPGGVRTITWSYKYAGDSYTVLDVNTPNGTWLTDDLDVGVLFGTAGAGSISAEFDSLTVDYTPEAISDLYAFIPTASFAGYSKNHLYIKRKNGLSYEDIDPSDDVMKDAPVIAVVDGVPYEWDGTDWVVLLFPPSPHVPAHEENGSDEAIVEKLGTEDTTTTDYFKPDGGGGIETAAFKHDIDDAAKHGGVSGSEDDIAALDANKLVKSTGKSFPLGHNDATVIGDVGANDHHPQIHDHDTHTNIEADDHHDKSHTHDGADGSGTVAHSDTTGKTINDHHLREHSSRHSEGGADEVTVENLATAGDPGEVALAQVGGSMAMGDPERNRAHNNRVMEEVEWRNWWRGVG